MSQKFHKTRNKQFFNADQCVRNLKQPYNLTFNSTNLILLKNVHIFVLESMYFSSTFILWSHNQNTNKTFLFFLQKWHIEVYDM